MLRQRFHSAGAEARILAARNGAELLTLARRAARGRPPIIVAGGGDGTVSAVASVLAGTDIALGILPLGTLNHFAKDLRIPLDLGQAARAIVAGHCVEVDVGEVNGRVFVNNSSIGLYPAIVHQREKQRRRLGRGKWHALFWAALSVLRHAALLELRLRLENVEEQRRTPFIFIGNNQYIREGFNIGRRARLDSGLLSLYLTRRHDRRALLGLAIRALVGLLHQAKDFEAHTAQSIRIETRHKQVPVATDGEVTVLDTPLDYRIRPRALKVIVPRPV
jgi:diacylglycerol kinase family enzyme